MNKRNIGIVGCGTISKTYLTNLTTKFNIINVVGVADIIDERAKNAAETFGVRHMSCDEIYKCDEIEIIVNLTYPRSHYIVSKTALQNGKHVLSEKMAAVTMEEADELCAIAKEKNLHYVVAPDTFLGGGLQTCRKLVDAGMIGEPRSASAFLIRGVYLWLPTTENTFLALQPGGGIPFDLGGYYLSALINMLGPIKRATGFMRQVDKEFQNLKSPKFGQIEKIETPNMMTASLEFASGPIASCTIHSEGFPQPQRLEVHGTEGTLICPDPDTFGGPIYLYTKSASMQEPYQIPLTHGYFEGCNRSLGVADLAWAIENNRKPRLSLGYHCFETIHGVWKSSLENTTHVLNSVVERPAPLPSGYVRPEVMETALAL